MPLIQFVDFTPVQNTIKEDNNVLSNINYYSETPTIIPVKYLEEAKTENSEKAKEKKKVYFEGWDIKKPNSSNSTTRRYIPEIRTSSNSLQLSIKSTANQVAKYSRGKLRQEILELLEGSLGWKHDVDFHLGEAIRSRNANYGSSKSHHFTGNAVDITPRGNMTFAKMRLAMLANSRIRLFFAENGLGIIDESTPEIRATHSWKATGDHYHIGPDRLAQTTWNEWKQQAGYARRGGILKMLSGGGVSIPDYYSYTPTPRTYSLKEAASPFNFIELNFEDYNYSPSQVVLLTTTPEPRSNNKALFLGWTLKHDRDTITRATLPTLQSQENTNMGVSDRLLNFLHIMEAGIAYGDLPDKLVKGIQDARGKIAYGAGLIYDPDTNNHQTLAQTAKRRGQEWTKEELELKFAKQVQLTYDRVKREMGNLKPHQLEALTSTCYLFGHIPESIKTAIKSGDDSKIKDAWMHAHDKDSNYSKYKGGWDKRSMFEYMMFSGHNVQNITDPIIDKAVSEYFNK